MSPIGERDLQVRLEQENLLRRIVNSIRQTLDLNDILTTTVAEVCSLLETDRVMIYKFHPDSSGQVIAESIRDGRLPSLLGLNFPADDIPPHVREMFVKLRVRSVVNVDTRQIGQSPLHNLETKEKVSGDTQYRSVDPCHVEYLTAMGVKSSLVTPIFHQEQLWGLLVSHHSEARVFGEGDIEAVQMVVDQLSVAIAQSNILTQTREKAQKEAIVNYVATLLHSMPTIELQPALEEVVAAFGGSGGRLCIRDCAFHFKNRTIESLAKCLNEDEPLVKIYTCGQQPVMSEIAKYQLMEQYSVWQEHYKSGGTDVWAIPDIYKIPLLRNLQVAFRSTKIRSILMIPLWYRQQLLGYLSIFRDEIDIETLWAGRFDPDERQSYPRLSFEVWRESKKGQVREWTAQDIELAQALGKQFALALQQYELYQQVNALNANLENQVKERTAKLQKVTEQQQALFSVITKMRESLDVDTIFQITTKEVCQLLQSDRVAVYRFNSNWGGEFVGNFEVTSPDWSKILKLSVHTIWNDTYLQETQGGRYRNNETFAVDDVYKVEFHPCHIDILEQFHIKAFILAPIFVGQTLWGLLATYQHSQPRHWEATEIKFMSQVAAQLGVALQQAELLTQTRQQTIDLQQATQQLTKALHDLQQAQTQLIQNEKMSSLGQLVAGVAHEINNPVNFIYGNISHISEYTKDLLKILEIYQQHYPNPSPEILERTEEMDLDFIVEDLPKILSSMKIGTERIRQIVLSLRNFSRLDQAEMKPVDIHEGIDSTLQILHYRVKPRPDSPGIDIVKEYSNLPLVECYPGQLNQVFMNVLSNAIDALDQYRTSTPAPRVAKITICTSVGQLHGHVPSAVVRIIDNGSGISQDLIKRIFDPFFTTKPIGKGTGLGLSISYQIIVDKHGGIFKCDSQPGLGTEFWIEIPMKQI
jgi:light-regulated signal transduction histidine kinase (bacteriophytochrome)